METAPRTVTSYSGNSSRPTSEAEYVFAHGEDADLFRQAHLPHEVFRFPPGGAAADGNDLYLIFVHQIGHFDDGIHFLGYGRMRINDVVGQEIALLVQTHHLAAGAETGVYGHHALLPHRRRQQQLPEVLSKHLDALFIGLFLGFPQDFAGDGRVQETLPGVVHSLPHLRVRRIAVGLAIIVVKLVPAFLSVGIYLHAQEALFLGPEHS